MSYLMNEPSNPEFSFGDMLPYLEAGYKARRLGWNGKNMCIYLTEASNVPYERCKTAVQQAIAVCDSKKIGDATISGEHPFVHINPHIDMVCADGSITCGWTASQTDMLANDWIILQ